jgi:TRAP-type C4-dicarboxylate transport system substrate-binding protein
MSMQRRALLGAIGAAGLLAAPNVVRAQAPITLNGASQFNDDHVFNRTMTRFQELVRQYYGRPINFVMHNNSSLGLEKQFFEYMSAGRAVDFGIGTR